MIVIDIGSSFGEFSRFIASLNQSIRVYAIDPNFECTRFYQYSMKNLEVHNIAIWSKDIASQDFYVRKNPELSGLVPENTGLNQEIYRHHLDSLTLNRVSKVRTLTLENFLLEQKIEEVDFLKIDTQGTDIDILMSAGKFIEYVKAVCVEVSYESSLSLYENELCLADAISILAKLGFVAAWVVPNGGGEVNIVAYNSRHGLLKYLDLEEALRLKEAPCLKIGWKSNQTPSVFLKMKTSFFKLRFETLNALKRKFRNLWAQTGSNRRPTD